MASTILYVNATDVGGQLQSVIVPQLTTTIRPSTKSLMSFPPDAQSPAHVVAALPPRSLNRADILPKLAVCFQSEQYL